MACGRRKDCVKKIDSLISGLISSLETEQYLGVLLEGGKYPCFICGLMGVTYKVLVLWNGL